MKEHEHEMLFRREEIATRVAEIGAQISHDFAGEAILLVGVLKGAAIFLADLARSISVETTFDFVAISSYKGVKTSGAVRLIKDLDTPIGGRNVILVEDILDTGLTLVFLRGSRPAWTSQRGVWRKSTLIMWVLRFPIIL
jgi:hypoxanthine phosphoribosyltransferase